MSYVTPLPKLFNLEHRTYKLVSKNSRSFLLKNGTQIPVLPLPQIEKPCPQFKRNKTQKSLQLKFSDPGESIEDYVNQLIKSVRTKKNKKQVHFQDFIE